MQEINPYEIVLSTAGHDAGKLFCVLSTENGYAMLANGKERKLDAPKRKKLMHIRSVGTSAHPAIIRLQRGEQVSNHALRVALAAFRVSDPDKGGSLSCPKKI